MIAHVSFFGVFANFLLLSHGKIQSCISFVWYVFFELYSWKTESHMVVEDEGFIRLTQTVENVIDSVL